MRQLHALEWGAYFYVTFWATWIISCLVCQKWERHKQRKREVIWVAPRYPESERT